MSEAEKEMPSQEEFYKRLFRQAYDQTILALDRHKDNPVPALVATYRGRNVVLDEVVPHHAKSGKAECGQGCAACCHQMVMCAPFEALWIAWYILEKTPHKLNEVKKRLERLAVLPLSTDARYGKEKPCALLENNECSIYDFRPSVCRTHLSLSRAACDASLDGADVGIPFIADSFQMAAVLQTGIDNVLISRLSVNTEKVELSRALLISLNSFIETSEAWLNGEDPFENCYAYKPGMPSNKKLVEMMVSKIGLEE